MARKAPTKLARLMKTGLLVLFIIAASVGATLYYSWQQSSPPAWLSWTEKGQSVEAAPAPNEPPVTKLFVLMGGHHYRGRDPPSEAEAVDQAKALLERHLGIPRDTPCHAMARFAKDCIPQHNVGHVELLRHAGQQIAEEFGGRLSVANGSYGRIGAMGALRNAYGAAFNIIEDQGRCGLENFASDVHIVDVPTAKILCRQPRE